MQQVKSKNGIIAKLLLSFLTNHRVITTIFAVDIHILQQRTSG